MEPTKIPSSVSMEPTVEPIDFVLVWDGTSSKATNSKAIERRNIFEANLELEGLLLKKHVIHSKNLNFLLVRAPMELLKRYGEILKLRMPIKEVEGINDPTEKKSSMIIQTATNCCNKLLNWMCGLDRKAFPAKKRRITTVYSRDKEYLFDDEVLPEYFTPAIRSRIVEYVLGRKRYKEGDENHHDDLAFGYERLINSGAYTAGYPLHDGDYKSPDCQRGLLFKEWATFKNIFRHQPLDAIKNYFGPTIGIYYAWLGYYTVMLIPASILGLICIVYGFISVGSDSYTQDVCKSEVRMCPLCDNICEFWTLKSRCMYSKFTYLFDNDSTALYAFIMSLWTVIFLEFWKRYSSEISHSWDLTGYDEKDLTPRPEYLAKLKSVRQKTYNFVTNTVEPAVPFWRMKVPYTLVSFSTMLILISVALAAMFGVILYRLATLLALSKKANDNPSVIGLSPILVNASAAVINLAFILVFNLIYEKIAKFITEMEIPRTQEDFDASYVVKIFLLQFINNYASIFYIAFIKGNFVGAPNKYNRLLGMWRQEECGISCMPELCVQLAVIMVGKQAFNAIVEMLAPFARRLYRKVKLRVGAQQVVQVLEHQVEQDFELLEWDGELLTEEYLEMVLQYGFVTIFVSAFPLAPLFALINNVIEVRSDAQKLIKYHRRPVWSRAKGIGIWYSIMDSLAKFAVLSNAFIIACTSNFIPKLLYRFVYHSPTDPRYGTLNGFLNHTLSEFAIKDFDRPPAANIMRQNIKTCSYPTLRYGYESGERYSFRDFHWQVWLGRVVFVLLFENLVVISVLFLSYWIPDVPTKLQAEIQREEFIANELIIKQELFKARGVISDEAIQIFQQVMGAFDKTDPMSDTESENTLKDPETESENIDRDPETQKKKRRKKKK